MALYIPDSCHRSYDVGYERQSYWVCDLCVNEIGKTNVRQTASFDVSSLTAKELLA